MHDHIQQLLGMADEWAWPKPHRLLPFATGDALQWHLKSGETFLFTTTHSSILRPSDLHVIYISNLAWLAHRTAFSSVTGVIWMDAYGSLDTENACNMTRNMLRDHGLP